MRMSGDYVENGYALLRGLLDEKVMRAILADIKKEMVPEEIPLSQKEWYAPVLARPAYELYGPYYTPLKFLLWGLTPIIERIAKVPLLPTYSFFRVYRKGDVCKIHSDRPACEHSATLTLAYSDDVVWPFHVGTELSDQVAPIEDDFGNAPHVELKMRPGDAVVYRGLNARHGRAIPNPNGWSAHVFLHWVERDGRYSQSAFECGSSLDKVDLSFV